MASRGPWVRAHGDPLMPTQEQIENLEKLIPPIRGVIRLPGRIQECDVQDLTQDVLCVISPLLCSDTPLACGTHPQSGRVSARKGGTTAVMGMRGPRPNEGSRKAATRQ